jgi:hypothetical protein
MNEIKNYTMNFSYGRSHCELNLLRKLAFTEIHCVAGVAAFARAAEYSL